MAYRIPIAIRPTDLTDLTITTDITTYDLSNFSIFDNWLVGNISCADSSSTITISSTGYETQTVTANILQEKIYLIPSNEVEVLSNGVNSYPIADKISRLMLEDKANISDIPTYSAMSVSEGTTGTATSSRVMRADYLKQIIEGLAISQTNTYYDSASSTLYIG